MKVFLAFLLWFSKFALNFPAQDLCECLGKALLAPAR
jgi:hypothetical protein